MAKAPRAGEIAHIISIPASLIGKEVSFEGQRLTILEKVWP